MAEPHRILVVEDNLSIRETLEATFLDEGYNVRTAAHGREALEVLRTWPAKLVLLDLMLPIMDGWVFLTERQRLGIAPDARIAVVSATRQARSSTSADLGVDAIIPKPFDLNTLLTTVATLVEQPALRPEGTPRRG
jgi:two-component system, chemotaxis family, chemotaxis protein CheY